MKKSKLPFNPYRGDISKIFYINRDNQWEIKRGRFKGRTIPHLISEYGSDEVLEFLHQCLEHEDCTGIERIQILEIISEVSTESRKFKLKF